MARRFSKNLDSTVRYLVRTGIREGKTKRQIQTAAMEKHGIGPTAKLNDMIALERNRQQAVDRIVSNVNNRRKIDIGRLVGCGPGQEITAYFTLRWVEPETEQVKTFGYSDTVNADGVLARELNKALARGVEYFRSLGYHPPDITSSMRSGRAFYRVEYIECT